MDGDIPGKLRILSVEIIEKPDGIMPFERLAFVFQPNLIDQFFFDVFDEMTLDLLGYDWKVCLGKLGGEKGMS